MRAALLRCLAPCFMQPGLDLLHGHAEILVRAGPARRMDAGRAAERIDREAGIVGEGRQADAFAAACALIRALARSVVPVSSGSGRPSSPADTASMP